MIWRDAVAPSKASRHTFCDACSREQGLKYTIQPCCTAYGLRCVDSQCQVRGLAAYSQAKHQKRKENVPVHSLKGKRQKETKDGNGRGGVSRQLQPCPRSSNPFGRKKHSRAADLQRDYRRAYRQGDMTGDVRCELPMFRFLSLVKSSLNLNAGWTFTRRLYSFLCVPDERRVRPVEVYPLRGLPPPGPFIPERKRPKRIPANALLAYQVRACRIKCASQ